MKFKPTVFALLLAAQPFIGNMALAAEEAAAIAAATAGMAASSYDAVSQAGEAFDAQGHLLRAQNQQGMEALVQQVLWAAGRLG
mgnify:CR=1 FL=1